MGVADIDAVTADATIGSTGAVAAIVVVVVVVVAFDNDEEEAETPCVLAEAADMDEKVNVEPFCATRLATFFSRGEVEEEEGEVEEEEGEVMASESMAMMVVAVDD